MNGNSKQSDIGMKENEDLKQGIGHGLTPASQKIMASSEDEKTKKVKSLRPWRLRFGEQFLALCYKQCLVYGRNWKATMLRIFSPLFFMFLLWLLDLAFRSDNQNIPTFETNTNPRVFPVGGVPSCADDIFINDPCWDFLYSPNTSAVANEIVQNMMANNPGRPISADQVLGFESLDQANQFLKENPEKVNGGVHFLLDQNSVPALNGNQGIDYVLMSNVTVKVFKNTFQDPTFFFTVPMQMLAEQEIAAYQWRQSGKATPLSWNVSYSEFAHPTTNSINIVGQAMGPFVFAANMFNFVLLMSSMVSEREKGLRQAMTVSGLLDSAFWVSWIFIELIISTLFSLLLMAFGSMFQFAFFLNNSFSVVFLLFLLFQWAMMGLAFIIAAFISKTSTAITLGFVVFLIGWVFQAAIVFNFPYTPDYYNSIPIVTAIFTLIPSNLLTKGTIDLGQASEEGKGISWSRRNEYCQNLGNRTAEDNLYATDPSGYWDFNCVFPIGNMLAILALEFIVYTILGVYLDNVLANENGVRKKPWYFLTPGYWGFGHKNHNRRALNPPIPCPLEDVSQDDDVAAEESAMKELISHRDAAAKDAMATQIDWNLAAVEVFGLQKAFGRSWIRRMFSKMSCRKIENRRTSEFWAIKGSWFGIDQNKLFCLLGPNGAGKTTTINCLTGVLPPTGGDALIHGESIVAPGGMERIRASMGVCPQFDVLWAELTGEEHMWIYGRLKGLRKRELHAQAAELLESVKLTSAARTRTGAYSGGMRRRLSVALALLGDPLVVYLDEPTTGMDPISRRHVWDVIEASKLGRVIVLTTHSMEEADILGDQVAIMARGRIRAFGSSLRLKQKFGSGYQLSMTYKMEKLDELKELFKEHLDLEEPEDVVGAYIVCHVPKSMEGRLQPFLKILQEKRYEFGISDVQINMTSLEEVFLNIARRAEIEAAEAEGGRTEEVRLEDGSILEVPLGEDFAVQKDTGRKFAIKWAQDETGKLLVMSWEEVINDDESTEQ